MKKLLLLLFILLSMLNLKAETFKPGSYIIDMGVIPQTYQNGLQPYGTVYDFIINHEVPLYWVIRKGKRLYEKDFTYDDGHGYTKDYKGSAFVIPAIYITAEVNASIADWRAKGVVIDGPTTVDFDADVFNYISSFPNAILDKDNAGLVESLFYDHTEIPSTYYLTGTPGEITACSDVYALPHADPQKWDQDDIDTYLDYIIGEAKGFLWQGCHSVGAVEAHKPYLEMFILTTNGQIAWSGDPDYQFSNDNTPNYDYDYDAGDDPIMQIASPLDDSSIPSFDAPKADFDITEDVNITVQNTFEIQRDAQDINISTHVIIHCKKFILGENVTINIVSGGSLTIVAQDNSQCNKNSSIVTIDGPEQFVFMGLSGLQLGDDGGIESYDGFYYSEGELKVKKSTTVNGAVTSNDKISLGETDPTKADVSIVNYNAAAAAKVDTSPPVTNGFTDAALFPEAMYVVSDIDKPNFNMVAPTKDDGVLDYAPVTISENMAYDKILIPENLDAADNDDRGSSALQGGSQEVYIPRPDSAWRSTTTVAIWDPDNVNLSLNGGNPNKAAVLAFGRAYGKPENGVLVQHTSHSASKGTEAQNVTSGRIYGNLLLQASIEKRPLIQMVVPADMTFPNSYTLQSTVQRGTQPYRFKWSTACGGSFDNNTTQNPVYTPDNNDTNNCIMRVRVWDDCNRTNFATQITNIHGYYPPLGQFNITHEKETFSTTGKDSLVTLHPDNALYTQITNKAFDVTLVSLNEADKETLELTYGNLILETVNTAGILEDDPKSCAAAQSFADLTSTIAIDNKGLHFNNTALVQATDITLPNAWKKLTFRVWHYDFITQEDRSFGIPVSYSSDKLKADFPNAYIDCSGTINSWACYQSITQNYGKAVCARDLFTVRPDTYTIALTGTTITNGIEYGIGGRDYNYTALAIDPNTNTDTGYTQNITNTAEKNITTVLTIPVDCNLTTAEAVVSPLYFNSGVGLGSNGQAATFSYNNVGTILLKIHDSEWTENDQNKEYPSGTYYDDCIKGSNTSTPDNDGKIGCDLDANKSMEFIAAGFTNTFGISNFNNGNFTYLSALDGVIAGTSDMYADINFTTRAVLADGTTTATNYTSGCYANNISFTIVFDKTDPIPSPLAWGTFNSRFKLFTETGPAVYSAGANTFNAGASSSLFRFNFDRHVDDPDNPFDINTTDFNITNVSDGITNGSDLDRTNETNATFYYAAVRASRDYYETMANVQNTPITVVVYCDLWAGCRAFGIDTATGLISRKDWWLSTGHSTANNYGDITLTRSNLLGTTWNVAPLVPNIATLGTDSSVNVNAGNVPIPSTVDISLDTTTTLTTSPWLIYNPDNIAPLPPLEQVRFLNNAGWGGVGDTGFVSGANASDNKKTNRLNW